MFCISSNYEATLNLRAFKCLYLSHFESKEQNNKNINTQLGTFFLYEWKFSYVLFFLFVAEMYGRNIRPIIKLLQLQCRLLEDQQLITLL